jgi:hypothetical protein
LWATEFGDHTWDELNRIELTGQRLWSVTIDAAGNPVATAHYIGEHGRIRHVFEGSDGNLWFLTNEQGGRAGPLCPACACSGAHNERR